MGARSPIKRSSLGHTCDSNPLVRLEDCCHPVSCREVLLIYARVDVTAITRFCDRGTGEPIEMESADRGNRRGTAGPWLLPTPSAEQCWYSRRPSDDYY